MSSNITKAVDELWDRFKLGGIVNPITIIEQISLLLFLKILEKEYPKIYKGKGYEYQWSVIGKTKNLTVLFDNFKENVIPFIRDINVNSDNFLENMKRIDFRIPKPALLYNAIEIIESVYRQIENQHNYQDLQGYLYEYLLDQASLSERGEVKTPKHLVDTLVRLADPKVTENICDPYCGTGIYLLQAYKYIQKQSSQKIQSEHGMLTGMDIDPTLTRFSLMNLRMHGIKKFSINNIDSIFENINAKYDVVLSTIPFGVMQNKALRKNKMTFEEDVINSMIDMLTENGRVFTVVPEKILYDARYRKLRMKMVNENIIDAVISLPGEANSSIVHRKTSVLVLNSRTRRAKQQNHRVWFCQVQGDLSNIDTQNELVELWKQKDEQHSNNSELVTGDSWFLNIHEIEASNFILSAAKVNPNHKISSNMVVSSDSSSVPYFEDYLVLKSEATRETKPSRGIVLEQGAITKRIPRQANYLFNNLAPWQAELFSMFSGTMPLAIHEAIKKVNKKLLKNGEQTINLQEGKQTVELFESFGLLERVPLSIKYPQTEYEEDMFIEDGDLISIELWRRPRGRKS